MAIFKRNKNDSKKGKLGGLFNALASVDSTYKNIPADLRLEVENISKGLSEFGPRKLRRSGQGMEFFEIRDFREGIDERRRINARLSAKAGRPVVIENEAEIRQHIYLWRDASASMDYASSKAPYTKKQASEVMLLALAKHLARNEEQIGLLDQKGTYRGNKAPEIIAGKMHSVSIMTGDMPKVQRKLPRHSTVVIFSDCMNADSLHESLSYLTGKELQGHVVMVLDPQELEFNFKGHIEFEGMESEGTHRFKKAESMTDEYKKRMRDHIREIEKICKNKGFQFTLQRTDEPLYNGLLNIYGQKPSSPQRSPSPGL